MNAREAMRREMAATYGKAGIVINARQAVALGELLQTGGLKGTTLPDVEPPRAVTLIPVSERESAFDDEPPAHTVAVIAEDGRCWSIVRAGITWPVRDGA